MSTFHSDLKRAAIDEALVAKKLEAEGFTFITGSPPGTVGWDFKMRLDGADYLFEQKSDYYCKKSNNVAIEFGRMNGTKSGMSATTSDFIAYMVSRPDDTFVICMGTADTFKEMCANDRFRTIAGGDRKSTYFKVVHYDTFVSNPGIAVIGSPFTNK